MKAQYIIILLITLGCLTILPSHAQITLFENFNNTDDRAKYLEQKKENKQADALNNRLVGLGAVMKDYQGQTIAIHLTFMDSTMLGTLPLKEAHIHTQDYPEKWKEEHKAEHAVMFYFVKQGQNYIFADMVLTQPILDGQVPALVANYIKERIVKPAATNNDPLLIVRKGVNALKNAYDRSFQKKLIERAPEMLNCRYYYRGYSCISTFSYVFKYSTIETRPKELKSPLLYLENPTDQQYRVVYLKNWKDRQATIFDLYTGKPLVAAEYLGTPKKDSYTDINIVLPTLKYEGENMYIEKGLSKSNIALENDDYWFNINNLFNLDSSGYTSLNEKKIFKEYTFLSKLRNNDTAWMPDMSSAQTLKPVLDENKQPLPVLHETLYELVRLDIPGPNQQSLIDGVDDENVPLLTTRHFWGTPWGIKGPTWCNVFAQYLSRYIYGMHFTSVIDERTKQNDYLVPFNRWGVNANGLFNYFCDNSLHVFELKQQAKIEKATSEVEFIWDFINKGYPVYFAWFNPKGSGHIETGFPDNKATSVENRVKYDDNARVLENKNKLVIGAGGIVGFKSWYDGSSWTASKNTIAFMPLQYLAIEYDQN